MTATIDHFVGGERVGPSGNRFGDVFDPSTGAVQARVPLASESEVDDICASFQRVVVDTLLDRTFEAARWFGARSVGIAGGVSANSQLRERAKARGLDADLPVLLPSLSLATDNAAMIAASGLRSLRAGVTATLDLNADPALPL